VRVAVGAVASLEMCETEDMQDRTKFLTDDYERAFELEKRKLSLRAKWRSCLSARGSMPQKSLTPATLLENGDCSPTRDGDLRIPRSQV